jgi:hypothetical protein
MLQQQFAVIVVQGNLVYNRSIQFLLKFDFEGSRKKFEFEGSRSRNRTTNQSSYANHLWIQFMEVHFEGTRGRNRTTNQNSYANH